MFLYMIFLVITIILGAYLGNAYEDLSNIDIFAETLTTQTLINFVFDNIITIIIVVGVLSLIIVFSKFRSGGGATI